MINTSKTFPLIIFIILSLLSQISISAQHRDESQMLRKPGSVSIHTRVHTRKVKDTHTQLPIDSIKSSEAAAPTFDVADEPADEYLDAGVRLLGRGDYIAALKSFGEASRRGNHEAQYRIGLMYRDGVGLNPDPSEAAYWFRKAGSNGHAGGQYEIALCFLNGNGVLQDTRVAAEWFWRAAEQGHPMASYYLAQMYRDGVGMKKDLRKASKYMSVAAAANVDNAAEQLQIINDLISKDTSNPSPGRNISSRATKGKM